MKYTFHPDRDTSYLTRYTPDIQHSQGEQVKPLYELI